MEDIQVRRELLPKVSPASGLSPLPLCESYYVNLLLTRPMSRYNTAQLRPICRACVLSNKGGSWGSFSRPSVSHTPPGLHFEKHQTGASPVGYGLSSCHPSIFAKDEGGTRLPWIRTPSWSRLREAYVFFAFLRAGEMTMPEEGGYDLAVHFSLRTWPSTIRHIPLLFG